MKYDSKNLFHLIAKVVLLSIIFGFFPVFLAIVAYNYNTNATSLIKITPALEEEYNKASASLFVLTQEQADTLQKINQYSVGMWADKADPESVTVINSDNTFSEWHKGKKVAYGTWRAKVMEDQSGGTSETRYMLQRNYVERGSRISFLYEVIELDTDVFVLKPVAKGPTGEINGSYDSATGTIMARSSISVGSAVTVTLIKASSTADVPRE